MKYTVLQYSTLDALIINVNIYLLDNWILLGGVCVSEDEQSINFYQAMTKS